MRAVTVGLIQPEGKLLDVEGNLSLAEREIRTAASLGADIVCLPELFATGYDLPKLVNRLAECSEPVSGGPVVRHLSRLARELHLYIAAGLILRAPEGGYFNGACFVNDDGSLQGYYTKNNLFGGETEVFISDGQYRVFETRFGKVGIIICYDNNFPEPARTVTLMGAELILNPCAWRVQDRNLFAQMTSAHACENAVFFGASNLYYNSPQLQLFGGSRLLDPQGHVLVESHVSGTDTIVATIDLDTLPAGGSRPDRRSMV